MYRSIFVNGIFFSCHLSKMTPLIITAAKSRAVQNETSNWEPLYFR